MRVVLVFVAMVGSTLPAAANDMDGPQASPELSVRDFVFQFSMVEVAPVEDETWEDVERLRASGQTQMVVGAAVIVPLSAAMIALSIHQLASNRGDGYWGLFGAGQVLLWGVGVTLIVDGGVTIGHSHRIESNLEEQEEATSETVGFRAWNAPPPVQVVQEPRPWGIVRALRISPVLSGPSSSQASVRMLNEGEQLTYWGFDESFNFMRVEIVAGSFGWVDRRDVEIVAGAEVFEPPSQIELNPSLVGAAVAGSAAVQQCFRDNYSPELMAIDEIGIEIEIGPGGQANWARITTPAFRGGGLDYCVSAAAVQVRYTATGGTAAQVVSCSVAIDHP